MRACLCFATVYGKLKAELSPSLPLTTLSLDPTPLPASTSTPFLSYPSLSLMFSLQGKGQLACPAIAAVIETDRSPSRTSEPTRHAQNARGLVKLKSRCVTMLNATENVKKRSFYVWYSLTVVGGTSFEALMGFSIGTFGCAESSVDLRFHDQFKCAKSLPRRTISGVGRRPPDPPPSGLSDIGYSTDVHTPN